MCLGHTVGLDIGSMPSKDCWIFLHMLKNAESGVDLLKDCDVDSIAVEHSRSTKHLSRTAGCMELMAGLTWPN